jgi:hypothetical protein
MASSILEDLGRVYDAGDELVERIARVEGSLVEVEYFNAIPSRSQVHCLDSTSV